MHFELDEETERLRKEAAVEGEAIYEAFHRECAEFAGKGGGQ
jgi:hypothetical protein